LPCPRWGYSSVAMRRRNGRGGLGLAAVTAALLVCALVPAAAAAGEEPLPPQGTPPPGANDFSCKPPARHPYPVVIVHGTFGNMGVLWDTAAGALELTDDASAIEHENAVGKRQDFI